MAIVGSFPHRFVSDCIDSSAARTHSESWVPGCRCRSLSTGSARSGSSTSAARSQPPCSPKYKFYEAFARAAAGRH